MVRASIPPVERLTEGAGRRAGGRARSRYQGCPNQADFGSPTTTTDYALCVYVGSAPAFVAGLHVPRDGTKWYVGGDRRLAYSDATRAAEGVRRVALTAGGAAQARVTISAGGPDLPDAALGALPTPVVAQLVTSDGDVCREGRYDAADVLANDASRFRARAVRR